MLPQGPVAGATGAEVMALVTTEEATRAAARRVVTVSKEVTRGVAI